MRRGPRKKALDFSLRINNAIRAPELRVIDQDGNSLDVLSTREALTRAQEAELDLIEISPKAKPPVAKIDDYGRYLYEVKKKARDVRAQSKGTRTETKNVQVKVGTGEHDLELKAKRASGWLEEGHRVKAELFLRGRAKYLDKDFLNERLERFLNLITEEYKIAEPAKKSPKGIALVIERAKKKSN